MKKPNPKNRITKKTEKAGHNQISIGKLLSDLSNISSHKMRRHSLSLLVSTLPITVVNSFLFWNKPEFVNKPVKNVVNYQSAYAKNDETDGSGDELEIGSKSGYEFETRAEAWKSSSESSFDLILDDFEHSDGGKRGTNNWNPRRQIQQQNPVNFCQNRCETDKCKFDSIRRTYWCDIYNPCADYCLNSGTCSIPERTCYNQYSPACQHDVSKRQCHCNGNFEGYRCEKVTVQKTYTAFKNLGLVLKFGLF